jgi:hypothetical protein
MTACKRILRVAALAALVVQAATDAAAAASPRLLEERAAHGLRLNQALHSKSALHSKPASKSALHSNWSHSPHGAARIDGTVRSRRPAAWHGAAGITGGSGTEMRGPNRAQIRGAAAIDGTSLRLRPPR